MSVSDLCAHYISQLCIALENVPKYLLDTASKAIVDASLHDATVFVFGNGGSSATASHLASHISESIKCVCLSDNTSLLTANANDNGYESVFIYPLSVWLKKNDLVIAISASGNSENVVRAAEYAKRLGITVIAFTGFDGGRLGSLADIHINVPDCSIRQVEDVHMAVSHILAEVING